MPTQDYYLTEITRLLNAASGDPEVTRDEYADLVDEVQSDCMDRTDALAADEKEGES